MSELTKQQEEFLSKLQLCYNTDGEEHAVIRVEPDNFHLACAELLKAATGCVEFFVESADICVYLKSPMLRTLRRGVRIEIIVESKPRSETAKRTLRELAKAGIFSVAVLPEELAGRRHFVLVDNGRSYWCEMQDQEPGVLVARAKRNEDTSKLAVNLQEMFFHAQMGSDVIVKNTSVQAPYSAKTSLQSLPSDPISQALEFTAQELESMAHELSSDCEQDSTMPRRLQTLQLLLRTDPIIQRPDRSHVLSLFYAICNASPALAKHPELMGPVLKEALRYPSLPVHLRKSCEKFESLQAARARNKAEVGVWERVEVEDIITFAKKTPKPA